MEFIFSVQKWKKHGEARTPDDSPNPSINRLKMEDIFKYILLGLLVLPFAALMMDAFGKTEGIMLRVAGAVAGISVLLMLLIGGLHQRPNVANIYVWAFVAWPFFLLFAKGINSSIPWSSIWISVPIMSWYLVNVSMQFYYPTNGGGGGLGFGLGLIAGWLYMVVPFAILFSVFVGIQFTVRRIKGEAMRGKQR